MDLVEGFRFFSAEDCERVVQYCDQKEKEMRKLHSVTTRNTTISEKTHSIYQGY